MSDPWLIDTIKNEGYAVNDRAITVPFIYLGKLSFVNKGLSIKNYSRRFQDVYNEAEIDCFSKDFQKKRDSIPEMLGLSRDLYELLKHTEEYRSRRTKSKRYKVEAGNIYYEANTGHYIVLPLACIKDADCSEEEKLSMMPEDIPYFSANSINSKEITEDIIPGFEECSDLNEWSRNVSVAAMPMVQYLEIELLSGKNDKGECIYYCNGKQVKDGSGRMLEEIVSAAQAKYSKATPCDEEVYQHEEIDGSYKRIHAKSIEEYNKITKYVIHKEDTVLTTIQQKYMLHYALQNAKKELFISCPWIKYDRNGSEGRSFMDMFISPNEKEMNAIPRGIRSAGVVCDKNIGMSIRELLSQRRFERLVIQFGYEADEHEHKSFLAIRELFATFNEYQRDKLRVYHDFGNHQKMVIMDNSLMVVGSYNFLSFEGIPYQRNDIWVDRKERGYLTRSTEVIDTELNMIKRRLEGVRSVITLDNCLYDCKRVPSGLVEIIP